MMILYAQTVRVNHGREGEALTITSELFRNHYVFGEATKRLLHNIEDLEIDGSHPAIVKISASIREFMRRHPSSRFASFAKLNVEELGKFSRSFRLTTGDTERVVEVLWVEALLLELY